MHYITGWLIFMFFCTLIRDKFSAGKTYMYTECMCLFVVYVYVLLVCIAGKVCIDICIVPIRTVLRIVAYVYALQ